MSPVLWVLLGATGWALYGRLTGLWAARERRRHAAAKPPARGPQPAPGHRCGRVLTRVNIHEGGCVWRWDRAAGKWAVQRHEPDWDRFEKELRHP